MDNPTLLIIILIMVIVDVVYTEIRRDNIDRRLLRMEAEIAALNEAVNTLFLDDGWQEAGRDG